MKRTFWKWAIIIALGAVLLRPISRPLILIEKYRDTNKKANNCKSSARWPYFKTP